MWEHCGDLGAGVDGQGQVFRHRPALIDAGGQGDRGPEQLHLFQVRPPVRDAVGEDWADEVVIADAGVETLDQGVDQGLVDTGLVPDSLDGFGAAGGGLGAVGGGAVDAEGDGSVGRGHGLKIGARRRIAKALQENWGCAAKDQHPSFYPANVFDEEARRS